MKPFTFLKLLFTAILIGMLVVTVQASRAENVFTAAARLWPDRWFIATLWDAYCGFLTFFAWVAYRETKMTARVIWFVLIMTLGNIAMSAYVLIRLFRLPPNATARDLLLRGNAR
ncbi:MAG: DUF1475 family protein [Blastocatellia bacterium]